MAFHDIRFPVEISLGAKGGPMRRTEIVTLSNGHEARNTPWAGSRRRYDAGFGAATIPKLEEVIAFFEARKGQLHSFRWRDPFDWKSCKTDETPTATDQQIATGDGATTAFILTKTYQSGDKAETREITKPVAGTVLIALDGIAQTEGPDFTVDHLTGRISLTTPPVSGANITAGYEFDVPVRFDTDQLELNFAAIKAGRIPSIPLVEVLS